MIRLLFGFMDDKEKGMSVRAGGYPENRLLVGYNWIDFLIHTVVNAPENEAELKNER